MSGSNGDYGCGRPRFDREDLSGISTRFDAGEAVPSIARDYSVTPEAIRYRLRSTLRLVPARDCEPMVTTLFCRRCGIDVQGAVWCIDCAELMSLEEVTAGGLG